MMKKWGILASLYTAQFLPVFLRQQGISQKLIGLTSLLSLPWMLKVLWSPLIDRYGWTKWGHYKFWIVLMQSLLGIAIAVCAFFSLETDFTLLLAGMFIAITLAATQDIATDALAIEILKPTERGWGNSIQGAGGYLGGILGGGVILILLDTWGWKRSLLSMALGIFLLIFPVLSYREKQTVKTDYKISLSALGGFFRQPQIKRWIAILIVYMMGVTMASTMSLPLLIDLGMSMADIGLMNGIVSFSGGFIGSFLGGFLLKPLGRKRGLIWFGILMAIAICLWILPTLGFTNLPLLYFLSTAVHFAYSMACVPMSAIAMDNSRQGNAGFDYTLQVTIISIGSLLTASLSGFIAERFGYSSTFIIAAFLTLLGVLLVTSLQPGVERSSNEDW